MILKRLESKYSASEYRVRNELRRQRRLAGFVGLGSADFVADQLPLDQVAELTQLVVPVVLSIAREAASPSPLMPE